MLLDCISMGRKAKHHVLGHDARTWLRSCVGDDLNLVRANIFPVRHLNLATKYKRYIFIVFSWTGILIVYQEVKLGIFSRKQQREHLWYGINGLRSLFFSCFCLLLLFFFFYSQFLWFSHWLGFPPRSLYWWKSPKKERSNPLFQATGPIRQPVSHIHEWC